MADRTGPEDASSSSNSSPDSPIRLDLAEIADGPVSVTNFKFKLEKFDLSKFDGKHVQLEGCAPTWAHLMVAGRLFGKARKVEFVIDNGKEGIPMPVFG
ncbi:MAG TPA: hypothetical protein VI893_09125 [Thermoplasmata archaeon]|nr:hypothetical protein [Thermoplasmata archaeon]